MMYRDDRGRWRCSEHRSFRAPDSHDGERKAYDHLTRKHQQLADLAGRAEVIPATARNVKRLAEAEALEQLEQLEGGER